MCAVIGENRAPTHRTRDFEAPGRYLRPLVCWVWRKQQQEQQQQQQQREEGQRGQQGPPLWSPPQRRLRLRMPMALPQPLTQARPAARPASSSSHMPPPGTECMAAAAPCDRRVLPCPELPRHRALPGVGSCPPFRETPQGLRSSPAPGCRSCFAGRGHTGKRALGVPHMPGRGAATTRPQRFVVLAARLVPGPHGTPTAHRRRRCCRRACGSTPRRWIDGTGTPG